MDRDDTLMVDVGYCDNPELVQLIPGAAEGIRLLKDAGYHIVIVTNQSGIGRGYFDKESLDKVNGRLRNELRERGADYDALYYCPHRPEEECDCRKPKPGLLVRAASDLDIDLDSSYAVGDRDLDVEAGKAAGTGTVLVKNARKGDSGPGHLADFVVNDLVEAAKVILSHPRGLGGRGASHIRLRS